MKEHRQFIKCCKRNMHGGQSGFSRAVDYMAVRVMIFIGCYLWFGAKVANQAARMILTVSSAAFIAVSLDLIHSLRLDGFIKRQRRAAGEDEFNRRLSMLTEPERTSLIKNHILSHPDVFSGGKQICTVCRSSGVSGEDVLKAARGCVQRGKGSAAVFHSGPVSAEAKAALASCPEVSFEFIPLAKILGPEEIKRLTPTEDETDHAILAREQLKKQQRKAAAPFGRGRTHRYVWAAACLAALSFFVGNPLYYRLMASLCILFGATAWWINRASA